MGVSSTRRPAVAVVTVSVVPICLEVPTIMSTLVTTILIAIPMVMTGRVVLSPALAPARGDWVWLVGAGGQPTCNADVSKPAVRTLKLALALAVWSTYRNIGVGTLSHRGSELRCIELFCNIFIIPPRDTTLPDLV